jgi:hypothetical protein
MVGDRWCIVLIATNRQHPTPTNHLRVQSYNNKLRMKNFLRRKLYRVCKFTSFLFNKKHGSKGKKQVQKGMFFQSKTVNVEVMNPDLFQYIFQDENPIKIT